MKKIGLITSYHGNYGSVLQCYATKKTIEKKGYVCDVIYEKYAGFEKIRHIIYRLFLIIVYSLFVPGFCFRYFRARKAAKMHRGAMEKDSFKMVDFFVNTSLKPKGYSYSCLKKLADKNAFDFFICGSDQIWNCNNGQVSPFAFLQFSNADKNIALSPSFGSSSIPYYCRKTIRKYLSKFQKNKITVREESGRDIIEHLSKFVPQVMPDPVNLLSRDEWSDFANNSSFLYKDYALLHFLNKPSFDALKLIEEYSKEGKRFIAIGYNRSSFLNFDGVIFINGAPFDYLWLIKNADYILTDSFHTTQFSILFSKPFLTFDRKYDSGVKSQSSRIQFIV